jgi:hypothetical protein
MEKLSDQKNKKRKVEIFPRRSYDRKELPTGVIYTKKDLSYLELYEEIGGLRFVFTMDEESIEETEGDKEIRGYYILDFYTEEYGIFLTQLDTKDLNRIPHIFADMINEVIDRNGLERIKRIIVISANDSRSIADVEACKQQIIEKYPEMRLTLENLPPEMAFEIFDKFKELFGYPYENRVTDDQSSRARRLLFRKWVRGLLDEFPGWTLESRTSETGTALYLIPPKNV